MKQIKQILTAIILVTITFTAFAQSPQLINYQAVARNSTGGILTSTTISVRLTIHDGGTSGATQYQETQSVATNAYGLFTLHIGGGTIVSGSMTGVIWNIGSKYLQVEIDPTGGSSYVDMGAQQLVSVPYALYAENAGSTSGWNISGNTGINPSLNFVGTTDTNALRFRANNQWAGEINPKTGNTSLGIKAGQAVTTGFSNVSIGTNAMYSNTNGNNYVAIGDSSLFNQNGGNSALVAVGSKALFANTTGGNNTAIGAASLTTNSSGGENTAVGTYGLLSNTTGSYNTATGSHSLYSNTTGNNNTATGYGSMGGNTTGNNNTASGYQSLPQNTSGYDNTANGYQSLYSNTTGSYNTANGYQSLYSNSTGSFNTAYGYGSLYSNTITGNDNTANGYLSLYSNSTGSNNTANGDWSLQSSTTGNSNTANGYYSLQLNTTGNNNTAGGVGSLGSNTTGNNNTAFGNAADVSTGNLSNAMALGNGATTNASNKVVIGNGSIATIGGYQNWSNLSDGRFKTDIQNNVPGLEFILKLRPVTYHFEARKFEHFLGRPDSLVQKLAGSYDLAESQVRTGFIAQEVEKTAIETGYDFSGLHKPANDKDNYSLAYAEFTVPLVKAVQEQQRLIIVLQKQVDLLTKQVADLESKK